MKNFEISKGASFVLARLKEAGFSAYLVGGCVRDFVMGKTPHDFDITTSATPDEMLEIFSDVTTFKSGVTHGTVGVHIQGENVEATTFRADGEYVDHRHPESVIFSRELRDDLSRRDFTMNALAFSENSITDLFGGIADIEKSVIRCVGQPEKRFEEDALRILRALRFSSVLDFDIHPETSHAIDEKKELLTFISRERVATEFIKLLTGKRRGQVISDYACVFDVLFKEANPDVRAIQRAETGDIALAVFFAKSEYYKENILSLKLPKNQRDNLISAIEIFKSEISDTREGIKKLILEKGEERVALALGVAKAFDGDEKREEYFSDLLQSGECITLDSLKIKGRDIVALGVTPSAEIGVILKRILDKVNTGTIPNDRETLIEMVKRDIEV
ncbi:MAG: CCA tRNA nucleotidyltransferase [Clostridia bacterium]|nr:CCA tRNA nucleotidyltransferase [Clostridia bacterium]